MSVAAIRNPEPCTRLLRATASAALIRLSVGMRA